MSGPALSARDVAIDYDGRRAAELEALDVAPGEVVALVGRNGSGKSTLLRVLALVEPPTRGTLRVLGRDVPRDSHALGRLRRSVTLALPQPWLFSGTVRRNVELGLAARGVAAAERRARAAAALEELGVGGLAPRRAKDLSSGEAARVALARALALDTPVLLVDEPFAHLDADALPAARDALLRRAQRGAAVLLAAPDLADLPGLAARIVALQRCVAR